MWRRSLPLLLAVLILMASLGAVYAELPESSIYRVFKWSYKGWQFTWEIRIPTTHYFGYAMIPLEERRKIGYGMLVTHDDPIIQSLASALLKKSKELGFGEYDTANFILAFVQDHYLKDDEMTPYDEYPKFPVETLAEGGGDCEDSSILYAALMKAAGYDVILLQLPKHMAVGVALSKPIFGSFVLYNGKMYFYAETTSSGWVLGISPEPYKNQKVRVIPIPKNPEGTQLKIKRLIEEVAYTPERFKQLENENTQLIKKNLELMNQLSELQNENFRLKMENDALRFQILQLNATIAKLKPKAEILDALNKQIPAMLMTFALLMIAIAFAFYFAGKFSGRKEALQL